MNSQTQQIINIVFIFLFIFTLSPISILLHISAIYMNSTIKSSTTLPCSYTSTMQKSSKLLKKIVKSTTPIPAKFTPTQKEAALPFLTQEPIKTKSSKAKTLSRFFKKLASKSTKSTEKKNTQYKLTFIPIIKKNEVIAPSKSETTEIVWYDSEIQTTKPMIDNSAIELAQRIWDEDNTVYSNLNKVVEWIGNGKESSNSILQSYMSHFSFQNLTIEQAFRKLCSKLHLNGETQQIDRVLLQFSTRYFQCNNNSIFGSVGKYFIL